MIGIRHAGAGAAWLVVWWATGCGSHWPHDPGGNGGRPGCHPGACFDAGTDAPPGPDAGTVSDASAADVDAADVGTSDGGAFDASNPPWPPDPACFAPCVLEAIKDCLPAKFPSCVYIDRSPEIYMGSDTYCTDTFSTTFSYSFHKYTMTVSNNGEVCYSRTAEFASNGPYFAAVYDGAGKLIATESQGMPGTERTVYCNGGPDAGPVYSGLQPAGCDSPRTFNCETVVEGTSCPTAQ